MSDNVSVSVIIGLCLFYVVIHCYLLCIVMHVLILQIRLKILQYTCN